MAEGVSMGVLMVFHFKNFKQGSLFKSRKEVKEDPTYASVMLGEYHRFDTKEVDANSLADQSTYRVEGSEELGAQYANSNKHAMTTTGPGLNPSCIS